MTKITNHLKKELARPRIYNLVGYLMFGALLINLTTAATPIALASDKGALAYAFLALETAQNPNLFAAQIASSDNLIATKNNIFIQAFNQNAFEIPITQIEAVQKNAAQSPESINKTGAVKEKRLVVVTAYSSTPDQTDDSPFITANGAYVYDGLIAANFLPCGDKVKFPDYFGDKIFTVEDRTAKRFGNRADIWMESRQAALQFGIRKLTIE